MSEGPEPSLAFELDGVAYSIALGFVLGLAGPSPLSPVPGAAPVVLGLAEWRGTLLTVLDLPALLGCSDGAAQPCLIRLAEPLRGVAFRLHAPVRLVRTEERGRRAPQALDPRPLVRRLEAALARAR